MYVFEFIPFLLAIFMFVYDKEDWALGPEYVFKLTKITVIHTVPSKTEDLNAMVKCQPKLSSVLICCIQDVLYINSTYENNMPSVSSEWIDTKQVFEINFHERGVQSLAVEQNSRLGFDFVKWIVEQINMGIELKIDTERNMTGYKNVEGGMHVVNSFRDNENIWKKSKCNTLYTVAYKSYKNHSDAEGLKKSLHSKIPKNYDFQLAMLPMPYMQFVSKSFFIKRRRDTCSRPPRYLKLRKDVYRIQNVTTYFNTIKIEEKSSTFLSNTHLEGILKYLNEKPTFIEKVNLKLLDVKPASKKFSINGKWVFQGIDE